MSAEPRGLLLSDDLIFASRIIGTALAHGLTVKQARSADALTELIRQELPTCVLLDLHHPELSLPDLLAHLRQSCPHMPTVVAYGSHVDAPRLKAARDAGCDVVLPRSAFVEQLPTMLPRWLSPSE